MEIEKYKMIYKITNKDSNNYKKDEDEYEYEEEEENEDEDEEQIEENGELRILGNYFVRKNKNKGRLIIYNKKSNLKDIIQIDDIKENILKIKMILNKNIYNKSYMFENSTSLLQVSLFNDLSNIYYEQFEEYENDDSSIEIDDSDKEIFEDSFSYENDCISDLSKVEEEQIGNSTIIYMEKKLEYSQKNYAVLNGMFHNCESLISLPDISSWKIDNVIDISGMFFNCPSLSSLPDISK